MSFVQRLRDLDHRLAPKARTPPPWSPEVGPLVRTRGARRALGLVFILAGGLALLVDMATPGVWWLGWVWFPFGPLLFAVHQPVLEAGMAAARPIAAVSPLAPPKAALRRSRPWLLLMVASVALPTAVGLAGFLFGLALYWAAEAWSVGASTRRP